MSSPLSRLWRWGDRFAFVRNAGTSDEATHLHHALICALGAGLGAVTAVAFSMPALWGAWLAWAACWAAYVVREAQQHGRGRWGWDGVGDLLVPLCWGVLGLSGGTRQLVVWLAVSATLGVYYTAARPATSP